MTQAILAQAPIVAPAAVADRRRWLTLALILGGTFLATFDNFVVNVAIPTLQRDLGASFAQVQFVVAGYALAYAVSLVTGGRLGDLYGRKRLFLLGLAGFITTSALCSLAPTPGVLIGARLLQGLSAAALTPQVLAIIQVTFPHEERAKAFSAFGAAIGLASGAGQGLGGLLVQADVFGLSWRAAFLINLPLGVAILVGARALLAESRAAAAPRLDLGGAALLSAALFLVAFPFVAGREAGWPWWSWVCLGAAAPAFIAFARFERAVAARGIAPLVAPALFRARSFAAGLAVSLLFNATGAGFIFGLALYLQLGLRLSPADAGLVQVPAAAGFFIAATLLARRSASPPGWPGCCSSAPSQRIYLGLVRAGRLRAGIWGWYDLAAPDWGGPGQHPAGGCGGRGGGLRHGAAGRQCARCGTNRGDPLRHTGGQCARGERRTRPGAGAPIGD